MAAWCSQRIRCPRDLGEQARLLDVVKVADIAGEPFDPDPAGSAGDQDPLSLKPFHFDLLIEKLDPAARLARLPSEGNRPSLRSIPTPIGNDA